MKMFLAFSCAFFLFISFSTQAEETMLEEIVVTATKTEQDLQKTGSSVTVITREEIERAGYQTLEEALRNVPGLTVVSSGPFGGTADVSIRGSKNYGHTLVLIDGAAVNDPMSIQRSFDFAHMTLDNVERIEIVRGPQSTLYGSDAIAGVINIITKKGVEGRQIDFSLWGGRYKTLAGNIGISGAGEKLHYSSALSWLSSDGMPKAYGGVEDDGYRNAGFSAQLGYQVFDAAELTLNLRYTDTKTDLDAGAFTEDPSETGYWTNFTSRVGFSQAVNRYWDHLLSFAFSETERKYKNIPSGTDNVYEGNIKKLEWQNNFYPADSHIVTSGVEYQEETGSSSGMWDGWPVDFPEKKAVNKSFYLHDQISAANNFHITPGIRIDDHEMFGAETTYRVSAAYLINDAGTRLKGSYGTGFKAPTLFQLYDGFSGNINLEPERSTGYDVGIEQRFMQNKVSCGATYFSSRYKNMIDWSAATFAYSNIGSVETRGVEAETKIAPSEKLSFALSYTYTDAEDKQTGLPLPRRPEHKIGFSAYWKISEKAHINLLLHHTGNREDAYWDPVLGQVNVKMPGYTKIDIHHYYRIAGNLSFFVKVENLFDEKYQEIAGYSTPGRSLYSGIAGSF